MREYSPIAATLWKVYAREFKKRWGMDEDIAAIIGARGKQLFAAEFRENGVASYANSVVLPIRNAFYAAAQMHERWETLRQMNLREPILDYGCGVGMQLLWLRDHGFSDLYAHEIHGVQYNIMESVCSRRGIKMWSGEPVETVLCTNVLEHVDDPITLLSNLQSIGRRVVANICLDDHEHSHVASHEELAVCEKMLEKTDCLYIPKPSKTFEMWI